MFFAVSGASWFYATDILSFLLRPVEGELSPFPGGPPVFTELTGIFFVTIELAIRIGALAALPFFFLGLYLIIPSAPRPSRTILFLYLPAVLSLHAAGLAFVFFIMIPRGVGFLLNFGTDVAVPLITINSYFGLVKNLVLWVPLAFQMPLIMWLLARARILTYKRVMKYRSIRKVIPLGLAIFTAVITPTVDPYNFFLMYIPMLLLFEAGMFLMWTVNPEHGNYLFIRSLGHAVNRVTRSVRTFVGLPVRAARWVLRKLHIRG